MHIGSVDLSETLQTHGMSTLNDFRLSFIFVIGLEADATAESFLDTVAALLLSEF